jgi:hypothetical protein
MVSIDERRQKSLYRKVCERERQKGWREGAENIERELYKEVEGETPHRQQISKKS